VFETVLVADRGLLAVRVIRCCQRLGIKAVTCVADGDDNALHARLADEVIQLGTTAAPHLTEALLEAARVSGSEAIHPGGGGWTDPDVAQAAAASGVTWVGAAPGAGREPREALPGWRLTVHRGGRPVLIESVAPPSYDDSGHALVAPDRLIEATTGVDLVERQLRRAAGEWLADIPAASGHAIAATLYAGEQTLVPVAVSGSVAPDTDGVVIDSVLAEGTWLTRYDDEVLAVITAHGHNRAQALSRLTAAVDDMEVAEPPTELMGLRGLLRESAVITMVG